MTKLILKTDIFKSSNIFFDIYIYIYIYIKISKNLSAKYYQENKKRLQKKACERYQNRYNEKKEEKQQYGRERYKILSEDEKQKLIAYRKNFIE